MPTPQRLSNVQHAHGGESLPTQVVPIYTTALTIAKHVVCYRLIPLQVKQNATCASLQRIQEQRLATAVIQDSTYSLYSMPLLV